jgi:hypothetical protein
MQLLHHDISNHSSRHTFSGDVSHVNKVVYKEEIRCGGFCYEVQLHPLISLSFVSERGREEDVGMLYIFPSFSVKRLDKWVKLHLITKSATSYFLFIHHIDMTEIATEYMLTTDIIADIMTKQQHSILFNMLSVVC